MAPAPGTWVLSHQFVAHHQSNLLDPTDPRDPKEIVTPIHANS
jgi:hypothetical protein